VSDTIGVLMPDGIERPTCGEFYCVGHADETTTDTHCTPYEYFGEFGVVVTRETGQQPKVSLVDLPHPQADFDLDEVPRLILQLCHALEIAQRAAMQPPAVQLAEQVRALFPAATA